MSDVKRNEAAARHVLITGGGSGIGAAIASRFAAANWQVTITGRGLSRLQKVADEIGAQALQMDVTDQSSVQSAFKAARETFGPVDVLVNNAGVAKAGPFLKTTRDALQASLDVNLHGVFNCTQEALVDMLEAGSGRVINIASTAALTGYAYVSAYCAAKHAVLGLTRSLALEFATKGITVNAICPGYTDTDIVEDSIKQIVSVTGRTREEALAELVKVNPQKRLVQPNEVAATALWLASPESAAVTGQAIAVAGGEVL